MKINGNSVLSFFSPLGRLAPVHLIPLGYLFCIAAGLVLLSLPFAQSGAKVGALDNIFISTSAISTTGLVTVSVADNYTFFGQSVVLFLIQIGGIGYMTIGSFIIIARKKPISALHRDLINTAFSLPRNFHISEFIIAVVAYTLVIEVLGAAALYAIFRSYGLESSLWLAVFHSVSAFCTAGFSLFNTSFEAYRQDFWLNTVISVLSYLGAIGFIVAVDVWRSVKGRHESLTLTSKVILRLTFAITLVATLMVFLSDSAFLHDTPAGRLMESFFQVMSALTTVGFDTVAPASFNTPVLFLFIILMLIGASPSGTGGGIKTTTVSALYAVMASTLRGDKEITFWGRPVPQDRVRAAVASGVFYMVILSFGIYLLTLTEKSPFMGLTFEATSALGTVGLSTGITPSLTELGKIIIIFLMYAGRLGPLTFGAAIFLSPKSNNDGDDDLAV